MDKERDRIATRLFQGLDRLIDTPPIQEAGSDGTSRVERVRRDRNFQKPAHPRDTMILEPGMVWHGGCTAMVDHDPELLLLDHTVRQDRTIHFKSKPFHRNQAGTIHCEISFPEDHGWTT